MGVHPDMLALSIAVGDPAMKDWGLGETALDPGTPRRPRADRVKRRARLYAPRDNACSAFRRRALSANFTP